MLPAHAAFLRPPELFGVDGGPRAGGQRSETSVDPYVHGVAWEEMARAYLWRMATNHFVPNSTVTSQPVDEQLRGTAFEFTIELAVPWVLRAATGGPTSTMKERGVIDPASRTLTLVCTNSTMATDVQFIQTVVYTALTLPNGREGCRFNKHITVDLYNRLCPKWVVDMFWKLNTSSSKQSRLDHDELARRLRTEGLGSETQALAAELGFALGGRTVAAAASRPPTAVSPTPEEATAPLGGTTPVAPADPVAAVLVGAPAAAVGSLAGEPTLALSLTSNVHASPRCTVLTVCLAI